MIILYTSPGCASCRKAKQWLKDNDLKFVEKNIFTTLLKEDEIKYLLSRTENGTEDIISTRSKVFQEMVLHINGNVKPLQNVVYGYTDAVPCHCFDFTLVLVKFLLQIVDS